MDLLDEQYPIQRRLVAAAVAGMPRSWSSATLDASISTTHPNAMEVSFVNEGAEVPLSVPSADLLQALREMFLLHQKYGTGLRRAVFRFTHLETWKIKVEYEYVERAD